MSEHSNGVETQSTENQQEVAPAAPVVEGKPRALPAGAVPQVGQLPGWALEQLQEAMRQEVQLKELATLRRRVVELEIRLSCGVPLSARIEVGKGLIYYSQD